MSALSALYCSVQTFQIIKFQLPIPVSLAVMISGVPFSNFAMQFSGRHYLTKRRNSFNDDAARLLKVFYMC